jgi:hypothetical protein
MVLTLSESQNSLIDKSIPPGKWWRIAKSVSKFKSTNTTNTPIKVNGDLFFHPVDKAKVNFVIL